MMALPPWAEEEEEEGLDWPRGDCSLRCAMRPAIEVGGGPAMPTASHDHAAWEAVWYEVRCSGLVPKGAPPTPRTCKGGAKRCTGMQRAATGRMGGAKGWGVQVGGVQAGCKLPKG